MTMTQLIQLKKEKKTLDEAMIRFMIQGYTNGSIPDYQMSAMTMAILLNGMNDEESTHLALAMRDSGDVIDLSDIEGIKVDKHSTGGVGDKTSLIIAPLMAHFGLKLAKMSGRGLGHTGGTLDKLESIPGFKVVMSEEAFKHQVNTHDISIIGQSGDVAPADKKLYALRDVTATVDSMPLIASSIMSKKLASGADVIVLDVKVGDGAFMKDLDSARKLATLMVNIGHKAGKKVIAVLTNMSEPLGHYVGNAHEVFEAVETLLGKGPDDLNVIVSMLSAQLLVAANIFENEDIAYDAVMLVLHKGVAFPYLKRMVEDQGGDGEQLLNMSSRIAKKTVHVISESSGYIKHIDALKVGQAGMALGAGRKVKTDEVDHSVGIVLKYKVGEKVEKGDILATLNVQDKGIEEAMALMKNAYTFTEKAQDITLIYDIITN
ncbi:MAG: thymidine phosphorylase [Acholeplasmataceae bacterium]